MQAVEPSKGASDTTSLSTPEGINDILSPKDDGLLSAAVEEQFEAPTAALEPDVYTDAAVLPNSGVGTDALVTSEDSGCMAVEGHIESATAHLESDMEVGADIDIPVGETGPLLVIEEQVEAPTADVDTEATILPDFEADSDTRITLEDSESLAVEEEAESATAFLQPDMDPDDDDEDADWVIVDMETGLRSVVALKRERDGCQVSLQKEFLRVCTARAAQLIGS